MRIWFDTQRLDNLQLTPAPLMISILWYSVCNFAAGLSPTFALLFLFRALLGIGMGAEWPAGAALAMESWPARSRGIMSGMSCADAVGQPSGADGPDKAQPKRDRVFAVQCSLRAAL
jgi:MFS family permease